MHERGTAMSTITHRLMRAWPRCGICSPAGLVGSGRCSHPGTISLTCRGVLFLDELPVFGQAGLQVLGQPLDCWAGPRSAAAQWGGRGCLPVWAERQATLSTGSYIEGLPVWTVEEWIANVLIRAHRHASREHPCRDQAAMT
jgi:hypothetical protein